MSSMIWTLWISKLLFFSFSYAGETTLTRTPKDFAFRHPYLGDVIKPGLQLKEVLKTSKKTLYKATYLMDSRGLRITPKEVDGNIETLFFGGSFVFGIGVNQRETLPFQYSLLNKTGTLNAGIPGGAPHQSLSMIKEGLITTEEIKKLKTVFYIYFHDHIARSNAYLNHMSWLETTHYYPKAFEDNFEKRVPFSKAFPIRYFFSNLFKDHLNSLGINFPFKRKKHTLYFCQVIKGLKQELLKINSEINFVVAPYFDQNPKDIPECVKKGDWNYIQTHEDLGISDFREYFIPQNGHPNKKGHEVMSKVLKERLSSQ